MKSKLILSATFALMVSSSAMAYSDLSSGIQLGQQVGPISNPVGTQCKLQQKAQAESTGNPSINSNGGQGSAARAHEAS